METKKETKTIYQRLLEAVEALPKEAIEKADKNVTRKGYDTTGYQYQFIVNVLNEVLGIGKWGYEFKILREIEGVWGNGKGYYEITSDVKVWIEIEDGKVVSFNNVGGHKAEMHADALKGSITNGFKKTVAFFGVGKKAYEGTIDDDYLPIPQSNFNPEKVLAQMEDQNAPICECGKQMKRSKGGKWYCKHEDGTWGKQRTAEKPKSEAVKKFESELDASMYGG